MEKTTDIQQSVFQLPGVIINEHHSDSDYISNPIKKAESFMVTYDDANIAESKAFLSAIWTQIATAFNNSYDEHLIFETQNEPADEFHPDCPNYPNCKNHEWDSKHHVWSPLEDDAENCPYCLKDFEVCNEYNQLILDTIRKTGGNNAKRFVMVPGMGTSVKSPLMPQFKMPVDSANDKLMLTVHDYTMCPWVKSVRPAYTKVEEALFNDMFSKLNEAFIKKGIPVVLGETNYVHYRGIEFDDKNTVLKTETIPLSERVKWITGLSRILSSYGIPLIYWDVGKDAAELDRENLCIKQGEEPLVAAMLENWGVTATEIPLKDYWHAKQTETTISKDFITYELVIKIDENTKYILPSMDTDMKTKANIKNLSVQKLEY